MAKLDCPDRLLSMTARKRFGRPNQYGQIVYGYSQYGEKNNYTGIYQVRHYKSNLVNVVEQFYCPTDQSQPAKVARQIIFASAILAWQALSAGEKERFRRKSSGKHMSGYNVFLHEYLISH